MPCVRSSKSDTERPAPSCSARNNPNESTFSSSGLLTLHADPDGPGRIARMIKRRDVGILSRWLNNLGSSGQAAFKFAWILGEVAGDVTE
jgi:hypothetical protein